MPRQARHHASGPVRPAFGAARRQDLHLCDEITVGGAGAPGRAHPLQGAHFQCRRDPLRRQNARTGNGAARSQGHASPHARRNLARALQRPRPSFHAVQDPARPAPGRGDKTLDARLDAVIDRNAPSPTGSPRKGVDNGLARYGAMEGALRQAVIHPHSTHSPLSERGHFNLAREGDISTLP